MSPSLVPGFERPHPYTRAGGLGPTPCESVVRAPILFLEMLTDGSADFEINATQKSQKISSFRRAAERCMRTTFALIGRDRLCRLAACWVVLGQPKRDGVTSQPKRSSRSSEGGVPGQGRVLGFVAVRCVVGRVPPVQ